MDEILLVGRSDKKAINDSMAFSIQSADSVSNMAHRLRARANKIQELNAKNSSLWRMLHDSQQETRLDMLQISNENILEDQERLMARLKRRRSLSPKTSRS
ncbi:unnamed protein product [Prunus brigantina]